MTAPYRPADGKIVPAPVSPDFTVAEFAEFVLSKPASEPYDYNDRSACAVSRFLVETRGIANPDVGVGYWKSDGVEHWFPEGLSRVLDAGTFGELAERLRAMPSARSGALRAEPQASRAKPPAAIARSVR
jgi:hypothetical protein